MCKETQSRCKKVFASCVEYQGDIPSYSELYSENCVNSQEVDEDQYVLITELRNLTNVANLDFDCLTAPTTKTINTVFQALIDTICSQQAILTAQASTIETMQEQITDLQNNICNG